MSYVAPASDRAVGGLYLVPPVELFARNASALHEFEGVAFGRGIQPRDLQIGVINWRDVAVVDEEPDTGGDEDDDRDEDAALPSSSKARRGFV